MSIIVNLDVMMARRKISLNNLAERVGISVTNLSILKTCKARAIRFSTLNSICRELNCQPGDILEFRDDENSVLFASENIVSALIFFIYNFCKPFFTVFSQCRGKYQPSKVRFGAIDHSTHQILFNSFGD